MPVTSITLSPTSTVAAIGSFVDLTATVNDGGAPLAGQTVTVYNSNETSAVANTIAQTYVGGPALSSLNLMTLSTPGGNSPSGYPLGRATETTGNGSHIAYINNGSGSFSSAVNETVSAVAEVQLVGTDRKYVQLFFYEASNGTLGAWFDLTNGTLVSADAGIFAFIAPAGSGTGFYVLQIRRAYAAALTLAAGLKTSNSTSGIPNQAFAGSTGVYINVGAAWTEKTNGVVTNASGQVSIRVRGLSTGTANIGAVSGGITSALSAVSIGTGSSNSTNPTISGTVPLPRTLVNNGTTLTSISAAPASLSLLAATTSLITVTGSDGAGVAGATATSSNPSAVTTTAVTNSAGQVAVTWVSGGSSTISFLYNDATSGPLTTSVPVSAALAIPSAPTDLVGLSNRGLREVNLSWTNNASSDAQFIIEKAFGLTGPYTVIYTTAVGTTAYVDAPVSTGLTYYYRVSAKTGGGISTASNTVEVIVEPTDTSGRGGFNRGSGGPGSSYGVGNLPLTRCPICSCLRNCSK